MIAQQSRHQNHTSAVIGVAYNEHFPESFRAITLHIGGECSEFGGSPQHAYKAALARVAALGIEQTYHSSSIDNFRMDGGQLTV